MVTKQKPEEIWQSGLCGRPECWKNSCVGRPACRQRTFINFLSNVRERPSHVIIEFPWFEYVNGDRRWNLSSEIVGAYLLIVCVGTCFGIKTIFFVRISFLSRVCKDFIIAHMLCLQLFCLRRYGVVNDKTTTRNHGKVNWDRNIIKVDVTLLYSSTHQFLWS